MRKILESKNNDDIKNLFKEKGIDVSGQQVDKFKKTLKEELIKIVNIPYEKLNSSGGAVKIAESIGFGTTLGGLTGFAAGFPIGLLKKVFLLKH